MHVLKPPLDPQPRLVGVDNCGAPQASLDLQLRFDQPRGALPDGGPECPGGERAAEQLTHRFGCPRVRQQLIVVQVERPR